MRCLQLVESLVRHVSKRQQEEQPIARGGGERRTEEAHAKHVNVEVAEWDVDDVNDDTDVHEREHHLLRLIHARNCE